ncbi:MAG: hypothetical protein ACOYOP_06120 [Microthrixaceae bacterium]
MRLLRLDGAGPGGGDIEFHPRLTVLAGAPASTIERVAAVLRAASGAGLLVDPGARVAVGGVSFAADAEHLAALHGAAGAGTATWVADPVLDLSGFAAPRRAGATAEDLRTRSDEVAAAEAAVGRLEAEVAGRGAALDAFAPAAREAARRRVEAARRSLADAQGTDDRADEADVAARVAELEVLQAELVDDGVTVPPEERVAAVAAALDRFEAERVRPPGADPSAVRLADRLSTALAAAVQRRARRRALAQLATGAAELAAVARRELHAAEVEAAVVAEQAPVRAALDAVRARIVELAERGPEPEARAELSELRSEEAELLDRLGVDTYTELVLRTAAPGRAAGEPAVLRARVELLEQEAAALQKRLGSADREEERAASVRASLVDEAAGVLAVAPDELGRLTLDEVADLLRAQPDTAGHLASVDTATAALRHALDAADGPRPDGSPDQPGAGDHDPAAAARGWLDEVARRRARVLAVEDRRAEVARELGGLRARLAVSPSARLRAELSEAEVELARTDERAARAAVQEAELAGLRDELALARAEFERRRTAVRDLERVAVAVAGSAPDPSAVTWALVQRIGSVRRSAPDGGLPLLLTGLDATLAAEVLAVVGDVLDEVQLVVAGDADVAPALPAGTDATVLRWA